MKRNSKIILGLLDILFVFISSAIGLWLLSDEAYNRSQRFGLGFFLMFSTIITVLTIINLLKKE